MDAVIEQTTHKIYGKVRFIREEDTKWFSLVDVNKALVRSDSKGLIQRYDLEQYTKNIMYTPNRKLKMISAKGLDRLMELICSPRKYPICAWLLYGVY